MSITTETLSFAMGEEGSLLLGIEPDMPATEALDLAADLADGVKQLCDRLVDAIDSDGGPVLACEIRAIGFLADTTGALARSVERSMKRAGGES